MSWPDFPDLARRTMAAALMVVPRQLFDKVFSYGAGGAYDKCFHRRKS